MNMHVWIIMGLTMVTAGGILHVFVYPYLSGDISAEKRQAALRPAAAKRGAERQPDAASRRKQITESIKELELRGKRKKQSLETRIAQAGFSWNSQQIYRRFARLGGIFRRANLACQSPPDRDRGCHGRRRFRCSGIDF